MYKKELSIYNNTYLIYITKSGETFFYRKEYEFDEWNLKRESVLLDATTDYTSFALRVIRTITKELIHYIHIYKPHYLKISANSDKKLSLYKKLLSHVHLTGYKIYKENDHYHLLKFCGENS